jgi:hypothetical protein
MSTRTVAGLRLTMRPDTWWLTDDGRGEVSRVRAISTCEHPHPWVYRDDYTGSVVRTHCEDFSDHDSEVGWTWRLGNSEGDVYPTFREAAGHLAQAIEQATR